jgi:RNA polymerase sigma-70 factor (ECF subfamily)
MRAAADFGAFYEAEHPRVLGVLCAVSGDREAAIEATDEAFTRTLERWARVRKLDAPAGWTYRVALNALRRAKRRRAMETRLLRRLAPTDVVPASDRDLWEAVRELPARQSQAIALRYVADLPEAEIARVMGIARGTVASTLSDARVRLAEMLREPALMEEDAS